MKPYFLMFVLLCALIVPMPSHADSFRDVYDVVKKALDAGEDAVDTANRALDTIDELQDIAEDIRQLLDTEIKEHTPLRKEDVMKLWLSDVPKSTIIELIKRRKCGFEITPDEIIYLKSKKMSNKIIQAMVKYSIYQSACQRIQLSSQSKQRVEMQRATGIDFSALFASYLSQHNYTEISFADYTYGKKITETNVGMGLAIAGGILNLIGGVLGPFLISKDRHGAAAAVMIPTLTVGTSLMTPGIVLWIRGNRQSNRIYDWMVR
ncbi:MAG: hypothetical protein JXX29_17220 [Deltaproteobacteria bacterium]|nr:hypothetical protein [Deltaproteobacteria bacterium]MBN2673428.1 hypothetical protein [Deltaproteobacteria bacterium]